MLKNKQYYCLQPAKFRLDGGAMFGIIPRPLWSKVHPSDEHNRIDMALRLQLIRTDEKVILIDTGIGDYHGEKFDNQFDVRQGKEPLSKALAAIGLSVDDVTDLIISHMHFDHIGGIAIEKEGQLEPVFSKATLHLHKEHYQYANNPTERDGGSFHMHVFNPIVDWYKDKNQIHWHEGSEGLLISMPEGDLRFKCSFGHTPWLMHPYDDKFIYLSDLIPTSNHIHIPWVMGYDIEPGVTTKYKREFLDFVIDKNLTAIFEHDPLYWGADIELNERKKYVAKKRYEAKEELATELLK